MEDPEWRDEYVLNDTGKVYTGNYKQVRSNKCIYSDLQWKGGDYTIIQPARFDTSMLRQVITSHTEK